MQFDNITSVANTFAQYNCRGNENNYVIAQDDVAMKQASNAGYYGGGLVGGMIGNAVANAVQAKKQEQTFFAENNSFVMLDVTESGIGVLAVKKAGLFKKWNTASVIDGTTLFWMLYSDMEFLELKKSMNAYLLTFKTKTGVTFRARIFSKMKELDYQEAGLQGIIARFGVK